MIVELDKEIVEFFKKEIEWIKVEYVVEIIKY